MFVKMCGITRRGDAAAAAAGVDAAGVDLRLRLEGASMSPLFRGSWPSFPIM